MRIGLGLGLGIGSMGGGGGSPDMILVYTIPASDTPIQLAIQANSTWFSAGQEVVIDWGDGSDNETVSATSGHTGYIEHTYTTAGTYTIRISGSMTMYGRNTPVDIAGQAYLTRVDSFGKLGIASLASAFYNCTGLMAVPKTVPDSVTNMYNMFNGCYGAAFNPDVSKWDVSNVTDMSLMFGICRGALFNPDVSKWNVSKVKYMHYMFSNCYGAAFNPDVSKWNVSKVENMNAMFYYCRGALFNPDVSKWNVSKVASMSTIFHSCSGVAFNPNIKSWTLKTGVTTTSMFLASKTQPTTWLDELLVAWANNPNQGNNITINFSPNKFTADGGAPLPAVATALATLIGKGWSITTANPYPAP
jgi:surface protein